jgi:serine protease
VDQNGDGFPDGVLQNTIAVQDPTTEGYFLFQGTSMASPHAAGAAAMVVAQGVTDPDKVEAILKATAQRQGSGDWDERYGAGIIDVSAAVSKAGGTERNTSLTVALVSVLGLALAGALPRRRVLGFALGVLAGSAGVLFPFRNDLGGPLELLTRGIGTWGGQLLGVEWYANPLLLSVLVPFGLVCLLYGRRSLRTFLGGLSIGYGAYLLGQAYLAHVDVAAVPNWFGSLLDRSWLAIHALASFGLGAMIVRAARRHG